MPLQRKQAHRDSWQRHADALEPASSEIAEPEWERAQESPSIWPRSPRTARGAAPQGRAAELAEELGLARRQLAVVEREKQSLQASLDGLVSHNSVLSDRLKENDTAVDDAMFQLKQTKNALAAAEGERDRLAAVEKRLRCHIQHLKAALVAAESERGRLAIAVEEANAKRQSEVEALNARLDAMSARALAAEQALAEARQNLQARTADCRTVACTLAGETAARDAAEKRVALLLKDLEVKERQVAELEQSESMQIDTADKLLEACKIRDEALVLAEEKISALTELFSQLDAEASRSSRRKEIEASNSRIQGTHAEHAVPQAVPTRVRTVLNCELDDDAWLLAGARRSPNPARRPWV